MNHILFDLTYRKLITVVKDNLSNSVVINNLSNSTIVIKPRARYPRQRIRRAGNDAFGPRQNAAADHSRVSFKALKSVPK